MSRPDHSGLEAGVRAEVAGMALETIASARWSGLAGRPPDSLAVLDAFGFDDGGALAILAATLPSSEVVLLTLPLAAPAPEPEAETTPASPPGPWAALHGLVSGGGQVTGVHGGRLIGRPAAGAGASPARARPGAIRPSPGDQSHTSVVIDERSILKLYRRLTPGPNPEAQMLGLLAGLPGAPVPDWHGSVEVDLPDGTRTTLAIEQAFVADTQDAFEVLADGLAAWLAGAGAEPPTTIAADAGLATGRLHRTLRAVVGLGLTPRRATAAERGAWFEASVARIDDATQAVGSVDPTLAAEIVAARPAVIRALAPLCEAAIDAPLQRIHGDLHLGQILLAAEGVLLVDFEGDPVRTPEQRRSVDSPIRDLAGFLRSIDHVARSGLRRATTGPGLADLATAEASVDGWIADAGAAFLDGYARGTDQPGSRPDPDLLRAFELDKELAEFVYAATFLEPWLYAPAGGFRALVHGIGQPVPAP